MSTPPQRRTVLFADVSDSSRLYREQGDVRGRELVDAALDLAREVVERHAGRVVDAVGDELFCEFQAGPSALEAAIGVHFEVADRHATGALPDIVRFRIGLHTGDVVVDGERVFGDAVHVAKRVSSLAKPEQVLCTASSVAELARAAPERFRSVDRVRLKGQVGEVELVEAVWSPETTTDLDEGGPDRDLAEPLGQMTLAHGSARTVASSDLPVVSIGRATSCDLVVPDDRVSRLHARVELRRDGFALVDVSRNGSYLLGEDAPPRLVRRAERPLGRHGAIRLGPDDDSPEVSFEMVEPAV